MNWGKGITIVIIVFLFAILMMVFTVSNQRIDLVSEDYYPKGIVYQDEIQKQTNFKKLPTKPGIMTKKDKLIVTFPEALLKDSVSGNIYFYRPSDKFQDRTYALDFNSEFQQIIDISDFKPGKYEVILDWSSQGKKYLNKSIIIF